MEIKSLPSAVRPWRVEGRALRYHHATSKGVFTIHVAPGALKLELGGRVYVLPTEAVIALVSEETRAFLRDPAVAPFLYGTSERESRLKAAKMLVNEKVLNLRRSLVARLKSAGADEQEAWVLACNKYPLD